MNLIELNRFVTTTPEWHGRRARNASAATSVGKSDANRLDLHPGRNHVLSQQAAPRAAPQAGAVP